MCVIVDANRAALVVDPAEPEFEPVRNWVTTGPGRLVHGGQLTEELYRVERVRRWLLALARAGRAVIAPRDAMERETAIVAAHPALRSDDPHVIALARLTGARTLCTE